MKRYRLTFIDKHGKTVSQVATNRGINWLIGRINLTYYTIEEV